MNDKLRKILKLALHQDTSPEEASTAFDAARRMIKDFKKIEFYLTENTNIRTGPSTKSQIITTLPKGTKLKDVLSYNSKWYQINFNNKKAYVYHSLVKTK